MPVQRKIHSIREYNDREVVDRKIPNRGISASPSGSLESNSPSAKESFQDTHQGRRSRTWSWVFCSSGLHLDGGRSLNQTRIFRGPGDLRQRDSYWDGYLKRLPAEAGVGVAPNTLILPSLYLEKAVELAKTIPPGGCPKFITCQDLLRWAPKNQRKRD